MTPEQFCYWLQGRAELQPDNPPSAEEWQSIRERLATVVGYKATWDIRDSSFLGNHIVGCHADSNGSEGLGGH